MNDIVERTEMLLPEPARALGALLGVSVPDLEHGESLPLLWHWVYLLDRPAQTDLGPDGHPINGLTSLRRPGYRRMWAGGRVHTSGPLICGESASKQTRLLSIQEKLGRSGPLTFITVQHKIQQRGQTVLDEQQDIVYRKPGPSRQDPGPVGGESMVPPTANEWVIEVSPTLLFRFSALTYNAHRIHYDRDYARNIEGYPGLLTHGPLQALAMAEAARTMESRLDRHHGERYFEYRLIAPLFDDHGMIVNAARNQDTTVTAVRNIYGRQTATAELRMLT